MTKAIIVRGFLYAILCIVQTLIPYVIIEDERVLPLHVRSFCELDESC